jgi:hypothetical protein
MVLQFLSYEGAFTAVGGPANGMLSTDIGVLEDGLNAVGTSLSLTGNGNTYADFAWNPPAPATSGSLNTGQSIVALPAGLVVSFNENTVPGNCPYLVGSGWMRQRHFFGAGDYDKGFDATHFYLRSGQHQ